MPSWRDRILIAVATCFGLGYSPIASGTVGTLPAVAFFVVVVRAAPVALHTWLLALALVLSCVISVATGSWAERYWGKKDPGHFVQDEVAGFLLTVLLFRTPDLVLTVIWAFVMTRIMDILKPPPAYQMQKLPGGWGILADDLASSLYAAGLLHILKLVWPRLVGA